MTTLEKLHVASALILFFVFLFNLVFAILCTETARRSDSYERCVGNKFEINLAKYYAYTNWALSAFHIISGMLTKFRTEETALCFLVFVLFGFAPYFVSKDLQRVNRY